MIEHFVNKKKKRQQQQHKKPQKQKPPKKPRKIFEQKNDYTIFSGLYS